MLQNNGYKIVPFPGCFDSRVEYIKWRNSGKSVNVHETSSGAGITLRLHKYSSSILSDFNDYLSSNEFISALCEKFAVPRDDVTYDFGIQKYLDGYEISPHPDTRKKALTYMLNINPGSESEHLNFHTHYLSLNKERKYVSTFWEGNVQFDRCFLPWNWCSTNYQQTKNNSIVLFSPSNESLHGVKATYNHFVTQRTQAYGNLWHKSVATSSMPEWHELDIPKVNSSFRKKVGKVIPTLLAKAYASIDGSNIDKQRRSHYN